MGMKHCSKVSIEGYWFNYFNVSLLFLIAFVWGLYLCVQCPCSSRQ